MTPAPIKPLSLIDARHGDGAELLLRVAIIAIEGRANGVCVSELRRLLGYPGHALDKMDDLSFAELVDSSDAFIGTALMIARSPRSARRYARQLHKAVENTRLKSGLPTMFRIS